MYSGHGEALHFCKCVVNSVSPVPASCGSVGAARGSSRLAAPSDPPRIFYICPSCPLYRIKTCALTFLGRGLRSFSLQAQEENGGDGSWEMQLIPFSRASQSGAF